MYAPLAHDTGLETDALFDEIVDANWAPPAPPAPPHEPTGFGPPPPPRRNGRVRLFVTSVVAAAFVGGGAGYAGATLAHGSGSSTSSSSATALAYTAGTLDVAAIVKKVEPSVVTISAQVTVQQGFGSYSGTSAGTGIILTADGEVLTNAHVVAGATSITVTLNGSTTAHAATLVGSDATHDVALLKIQGVSGLTPATIGTTSVVVVGQDVVAIGNALDLEGGVSVTRGIISALNRSIDVENEHLTGMLQTDAAISSGNSGGPLVNAAGQVIGMNSAGATSSGTVNAENIGFAITIDSAMQVVARLRAGA